MIHELLGHADGSKGSQEIDDHSPEDRFHEVIETQGESMDQYEVHDDENCDIPWISDSCWI